MVTGVEPRLKPHAREKKVVVERLRVEEMLSAQAAVGVLPRFLTPVTLGIFLFLLVTAIVVFSPSSESRFIYTDF